MLTFTTFNLKKTSLVTVLQKTSFIQKRFMKRASDEAGKKALVREMPIQQRGYTSLASSNRRGAGMLSQLASEQSQRDMSNYRRNFRPSGIQARNACTRAEYEKEIVKELGHEIVKINDPSQTKINNKFALFDLKENVLVGAYTKCKQFFNDKTQTWVSTLIAAAVPVHDTCCTSKNENKNEPGLTYQNIYPIDSETPFEKVVEVEGFDLNAVKQSIKYKDLRKTAPEAAKQADSQVKLMVKSIKNKPDRLGLADIILDEEKIKQEEKEKNPVKAIKKKKKK